ISLWEFYWLLEFKKIKKLSNPYHVIPFSKYSFTIIDLIHEFKEHVFPFLDNSYVNLDTYENDQSKVISIYYHLWITFIKATKTSTKIKPFIDATINDLSNKFKELQIWKFKNKITKNGFPYICSYMMACVTFISYKNRFKKIKMKLNDKLIQDVYFY